jgi:hypothetical protein
VAARGDAELQDVGDRLHADGAVEELAATRAAPVAVERRIGSIAVDARCWERFGPE